MDYITSYLSFIWPFFVWFAVMFALHFRAERDGERRENAYLRYELSRYSLYEKYDALADYDNPGLSDD